MAQFPFNDFNKMFGNIQAEMEKNMTAEQKANLEKTGTELFNVFFPGQGFSCGTAGTGRKNNGTNQNWCGKKRNAQSKNDEQTEITVPLKNFKPSTVRLNLNERGCMTISATNEEIKETNRNGLRKVTTILDETVQLPSYLIENFVEEETTKPTNSTEQSENFEVVDNNDMNDQKSSAKKKTLLTKVKSKFDNGNLVITFPEKPKSKEEENQMKDDSTEPVEIEIEFC